MEISVIGPANLDTIKRLEDEGVSRVTIRPPAFEPEALSSGLEKINRDIIGKI
jgi:hypothetical protein